jgi:hypothetical protein
MSPTIITVNDNYAVRLGWERLKGGSRVATIVQEKTESTSQF